MDKLTAMVADYTTGKFTIAMLSEKYGVSVGKTYYMLRDKGCEFIHKRRKPISDEERMNRSKAGKGRKPSEKQIEAIKKANSCDYNGLNGYGHTKRHNGGYILAYAPHHPNAHKDGYVMMHTILMERAIGRYLSSDEVVHHINHNKADNRLENLMLMKKHDHRSMHMKEEHEKRRNDLSIG